MSAGDIYSKSKLGLDEVSSRKMKLSPRMRTMLILVDGHAPMFLLREEAQKLGAAPDFLDQLESLGLIVKTGSVVNSEDEQLTRQPEALDEFSRFRRAQDFMNVTAVNALGLKSFFFTLKLERASTLADLRGLVETYKAAIVKSSGNEEAEVLTQRLLGML
ncbi:MAG TPA: hypothetical protein VM532_07870 [Burkholderiales bacterium]|nr:hypothetical protein [Burkholderiales bacterium]